MEYTVLKHKNSIVHLVNPFCMYGYGKFSKGVARIKFTPYPYNAIRIVLCKKIEIKGISIWRI